MLLTKAQVKLFWTLWGRAEREVMPVSATRAERDEFRRGVIRRATGKDSLRGVNPAAEFDALMFEVATMAEDYEGAAYWGNAAERRYAKMMMACARQIAEIQADNDPSLRRLDSAWAYCVATLKQAGLPERWEDVPESLLAATFKMLDTHRRRLLKREPGWGGGLRPLGFSPGRSYWRDNGQLVFSDTPPNSSRRGAEVAEVVCV